MTQIAAVTTWASLQVLTAAALDGEFTNGYNNWNNHDNGTNTMTSPKATTMGIGAGTAGAPSLYNSASTTYGLYFPSSSTVSLASNGAEALRINSSQQILSAINGSVGTPSFATVSFPTTGFFFTTTEVDITLGGTGSFTFNTAQFSGGDNAHLLGATTARWQQGFFMGGTAAAPALAVRDTNTGFFSGTSSEMDVTLGGTGSYTFGTGAFTGGDNARTCGANGARWSAVWAVNGTIQTSMLSTKASVDPVLKTDIVIPDAIKFLRPDDTHNSKQIGFAADSLPPECFAVIDDQGTRSTTAVYTSSVIGMLCAAIKDINTRLTKAAI